jgi:hypothetical protein
MGLEQIGLDRLGQPVGIEKRQVPRAGFQPAIEQAFVQGIEVHSDRFQRRVRAGHAAEIVKLLDDGALERTEFADSDAQLSHALAPARRLPSTV